MEKVHEGSSDAAANYLESQFALYGYPVQREEFEAAGVKVRNLEVTVASQSRARPARVFQNPADGQPCARQGAEGPRRAGGGHVVAGDHGHFSDGAGSQKYPWPLNQIDPTQGNFIAFVETPSELRRVRKVVRCFRSHAAFPSEGIAAPRVIPGMDYSDHAAYIDEGYAALMVTDTAPYRYPHHHTRQDTPDKVDFDPLVRLVQGL